MKLTLPRTGLFAGLIAGVLFFSGFTSKAGSAGCSDAGIASLSGDSVCYNDTVALILSGYTGAIQWQSFDGTNWVNETGTGSTTAFYQVALNASTDFRAVVTQSPCPADTSNIVTITVGTIPVPSANAVSRCGPGMVTLNGTGSGTLAWYDDPMATTPIATGNPASVYVPGSTTLYVADQTFGGGGSVDSPILIMEMELDITDHLEIQNVGPITVDVTGWKVAINNSYNDINQVNTIVQTLNGVMNPGDMIIFSDVPTTPYNYWGNNILWNPGAFPSFTGWALIIDDQNNLRDFVPLNWPAANIQAMSVVVNGATLTPGAIWNGDGVDINLTAGATSVQRTVTQDHNDLTDFTNQPTSPNVNNVGLTYPFTGYGCSSPLVPVAVTITAADPVTINASSTNFCLSGSATLTASSNNSSYNYTWSPGTGLSSTTGASVTCSPPGPGLFTYVVVGDDGTCSNVDTVTIDVGTPTAAGNAVTFADTICLGFDTDLILNGSSGTVQWQTWNGSSWVNATGSGSDSTVYNVAPTANTTYRAYLSSGSCPPDSSNSIDITVVTVQSPTTTDTTICGSGTVTLYASASQGTLYWYGTPTGGLPVNQGNSYIFPATTTTTYYVEEFAGTVYTAGPNSPGFGNQTADANAGYGIGFDVSRDITLDYIYVFPSATGTVTVNLRQSQGGPILATTSMAVTQFAGATAIPLNFAVPTGTGYRLELGAGSPNLSRNSSGATYPYTSANNPVSITGFLAPAFSTAGSYYYFYDWVISEGCRSMRTPATCTVVPYPPTATISQNFNVLTSSAPSGNQWFLNGSIISGATGQTLNITQTGTYSVLVTVNGCSTFSNPFVVTTVGIGETTLAGFNIYPNPANDFININMPEGSNSNVLTVYDIAGKKVLSLPPVSEKEVRIATSELQEGVYILEIVSEKGTGQFRFQITR